MWYHFPGIDHVVGKDWCNVNPAPDLNFSGLGFLVQAVYIETGGRDPVLP